MIPLAQALVKLKLIPTKSTEFNGVMYMVRRPEVLPIKADEAEGIVHQKFIKYYR